MKPRDGSPGRVTIPLILTLGVTAGITGGSKAVYGFCLGLAAMVTCALYTVITEGWPW